jgi:hypothetical protein
VVRRVAKARKMPGLNKVPVVFTAATVAAVATQVRAGVREVQVLGSYLAHRLQTITGVPADPELVKRLTVELYLHPTRRPDLTGRRPRVGGLLRRWLLRGALGRDTSATTSKALKAAEKLDLVDVARDWGLRYRAIEAGSRPVGTLGP